MKTEMLDSEQLLRELEATGKYSVIGQNAEDHALEFPDGCTYALCPYCRRAGMTWEKRW